MDENSESLQAGPEIKKDKPQVSIDFYFGAHHTEADLEGLKERLKKVDVFIPEASGLEYPQDESAMNAVSRGKKTPEQAMSEMSTTGESPFDWYLRLVFNSGKRIIFLDVRKGDKLMEMFEELGEYPNFIEFDKRGRIKLNGDFQEALNSTEAHLKSVAKLEKEREERIVGRLERLTDTTPGLKLNTVVTDYPELQDKDNIKILVSIGMAHTGIYHKLKNAGNDARREFSIDPVYNLESEVLRRYMFGNEVDETLIARTLLEILCYEWFVDYFEDLGIYSEKMLKVMRGTAASFTLEEVESLYNRMKKITDKGKDAKAVFQQELERKGLYPLTPDVVDRLTQNSRGTANS